ncbi:hypothetical protein FRC19_005052 [Serendipita sp. 401]|nr:hypothetical protein FRC19_005052 [Serendipita sp. 401]KAG8837034.1 hypothetical protein FRC18_010153 [Serendipita sp. 400]KAG9029644.1 hypothetical protein FS842_004545 [Serendipita sp. 407]
MSAQRTNRASHHEARQKVTPLNQTERFARRTRPSSPLFPSSFQPTPLPLRPPMVVQNDVVAFPARPELEIYDDSDEEMEMRSGSDDGEGDISERTGHDDDDAESVPETECTYGGFEGLEENDSAEESDAEIEYEVEEGPITIDLEVSLCIERCTSILMFVVDPMGPSRFCATHTVDFSARGIELASRTVPSRFSLWRQFLFGSGTQSRSDRCAAGKRERR